MNWNGKQIEFFHSPDPTSAFRIGDILGFLSESLPRPPNSNIHSCRKDENWSYKSRTTARCSRFKTRSDVQPETYQTAGPLFRSVQPKSNYNAQQLLETRQRQPTYRFGQKGLVVMSFVGLGGQVGRWPQQGPGPLHVAVSQFQHGQIVVSFNVAIVRCEGQPQALVGQRMVTDPLGKKMYFMLHVALLSGRILRCGVKTKSGVTNSFQTDSYF